MGIYDRDYMKRDDRPPAPAGGRLGWIAFVAVLLALVIFLHRAHPSILRNFVVRPWVRFIHRFERPHHRHHRRAARSRNR